MQGRYGPDTLSLVMLVAALIINAVGNFTHLLVLSVISLALLALAFFRMLSRDFSRRYAENQKLLGLCYKLRNCFFRQKDKLAQSKDYRFFKCPSCKNNLRVPRGKGRVYVTCPRCGERFMKKT